ncbi:MAG: hypothetical protein ABI813_08040 [Bacteroidota bacterium]
MQPTHTKYMQISQLGTRFNLSFSGYEKIGNKIMAFDGVRRKLLIIDAADSSEKYDIIELNEISKISIKKIFNSIEAGELKKRSLEQFIKNICLQFNFRNRLHSVVLSFYDRENDSITEALPLEKKARNWQILLSKIIGGGKHASPAPVATMPRVEKKEPVG